MQKCLITIIFIAVVLSGCGGGPRRLIGRGQAPEKGQISKIELRDELDRFEDLFTSFVDEAVEEVNAGADTRKMQRTNIQMRTRVFEALHAMTSADDSVVAFFDTWAFVIRLRLYLGQGDGSNLLGEYQPIAVNLIRTAEADIERIGQLFLSPEQFEELQRHLEIFARQHPVTGNFANLMVFATQDKKKEASALAKTLGIPMAPIRAMEGVDKTGDAILKVRNSVERFTNVAEQMPESVRWQLSMAIDDFEDSQMTQSFLDNLNAFSQSGSRLVEVMESMPHQLRTELVTALNESEQGQQHLQTTLQTATETADQLGKTLQEFQKTTQAFNVTVDQATDAAAAWEKASDSIHNLVMLFKTRSPRDPDAPPPFGMHDFDNMLTNAGQTADKVTETIVQLQQTIDSEAGKGIHQRLYSLVDHIVIRLFQFVLAVLVLMILYHYVKKKLT